MKFPWFIWIPRCLIILLALFAALFSLDVFETEAGFGQKMLGLLMHNIPSLILLLILLLTWKRPLLGGVFFILAGLAAVILIAIYFSKFFVFDLFAFVLPMLIAAALFIMAHYKRKPTEVAPKIG